MRSASITLAFGSLLWFVAGAAQGFGFGRASSPTVLGENLNFTTVVRVEPDEQLVPECIVADVMSGDNRLMPQTVRVAVEPGGTASERLLRVTSTVHIDEPVVTVTVTLGCTNRVSRKFVAFIDPPNVNLAQSSIVESTPTEPPRAEAATAPAVAVAQASPTTVAPAARPVPPAPPKPRPKPRPRPPAAAKPAPAAVTAAPAVAPARSPASAPAPSRTAEAAAPSQARPAARAPGSRLELEAAAPPAKAAASAPIAEAPAAAASAVDVTVALLAEQSAMLAKERARLLALEESLNRLRAETQATQTTMAAMQARLKAAEAERYSNPVVYALAWLSALLAAAVVVLLWRQTRARRDAQWWTPAQQQSAAAAAAREAESEPPESEPQAPEPRRAPIITAPQTDSVMPVWADSRLTEAPPDMVPEPRRDLSVEELIDLEQQAEFFVVLGQDEAAIDLLMGHVRSTGGISPLPYLKLLEIYKRRGDRSAYERIRERFNRRFNAYAPDWETDLQQGKSLEDYPATMVKLEGLWGMPQRVMETLDASLFRRDETEEAYDLPAYRELLFLYSVARDFTTRAAVAAEASTGVDLLLPMDSPSAAVPASRLSAAASAAAKPTDFGSPTLDMEMTSPMPVSIDAPRRYERSEPSDLSLSSDFLDLPELPTGPGKLGSTDKT